MIARVLFNAVQERVSHHKTRRQINRVLSKFLPSPFPMQPAAVPLCSSLEEVGYVFLRDVVSENELRKLRRDLEERPCHDPWRPEIGTFSREHVPEGTNNAHILGVAELEEAIRIANHPLILNVVQQYLECRPTIDDLLAWWSVPGRPQPIQEQFFHRDRDAIRFVKLFVYLSDVLDTDGPHVFVRGSHTSDGFLGIRRRYSDEEVFAKLPRDSEVRITGGFGTCFLEDTFGLHKGTVPQGLQPRLLLQARYTSIPSSFVRRRSRRMVLSSGLDPYVNRFLF
jgi:hypothetical protein